MTLNMSRQASNMKITSGVRETVGTRKHGADPSPPIKLEKHGADPSL